MSQLDKLSTRSPWANADGTPTPYAIGLWARLAGKVDTSEIAPLNTGTATAADCAAKINAILALLGK